MRGPMNEQENLLSRAERGEFFIARGGEVAEPVKWWKIVVAALAVVAVFAVAALLAI